MYELHDEEEILLNIYHSGLYINIRKHIILYKTQADWTQGGNNSSFEAPFYIENAKLEI